MVRCKPAAAASMMACALLLLLLLAVHQHSAALPAPTAPALDPNGRLYARMADLVVSHGYPLEEHFVETVDGYILRMFRIPRGRTRPQQQQQQQRRWQAPARHLLSWPWSSRQSSRLQESSSSRGSDVGAGMRPVVHLQHGLLGSATDWVLNGPGFSLPFLLADAGYDVWFGNVRGNIFSRNHTTLDLLNPKFWAFSWDEMAARDLPAMLTQELLLSGAGEVAYVGHSQGTTLGMAFLASHAGSGLAERIKVAVLLAPVAFVTHVDSVPLLTLAQFNTDQIFTLLGFHEFMPSIEVLSKLEGQLCKLQPALCVNILAAICGYNPSNLDQQRLPTYVNYTPSGTSVQNMAHWSQAVRSPGEAVMRYYDYGTSCRTLLDTPRPCNQAVYGQLVPPMYNLSSIDNQLVLFTGGEDRLADPRDLKLMLKVLPSRHILLHQHFPDYEHLDFIWGINAGHRVYTRVLDVLASMEMSQHVNAEHQI